MRRKYKNQLFNELTNSRLGINNFTLREEKSEFFNFSEEDTIEVKNTPFKFVISTTANNFDLFSYQFTKYTPNFTLSDGIPNNNYCNFEVVLKGLRIWLNSVIEEYLEDIQQPDLWNEFINGSKILDLNSVDIDDQTNFSFDERKQIELSLNELKYLIEKNITTTKEEQDLVNKRIDYLIEATNRLNKFDWKGLATSTIISMIVNLTLDVEKGRLLMQLFNKVFASVPMLLSHIAQ